MRLIGVTRKPLRQQPLQLELDRRNCVRVEELTKVLAAEQLVEQVAVERQRLRAALGEWLIALVHVLGHIREEERGGEGGRPLGVDGYDTDLS